MDRTPVIDYAAHPAYSAHALKHRPDAEAEALTAEIDAAYEALDGSTEAPEILLARFDRDIAPKVAALRVHLSARVRPQFAEFLDKAMTVANRFLRTNLTARDPNAAGRNDTRVLTEPLRKILPRFREEGCVTLEKTDLARRVWAATKVERFLLRRKREKAPKLHCVMPLHPYSPAFRMIQQMAEESGLVDFVSAYMGKDMDFSFAALDHAHPDQDWYKGCYADAGLPTSKTVYMHFDADFDIIKALFYLQDVGPDDGPFRFVPGSHNWNRSSLTVAVQNGFDEATRQVFAAETRNRGYYRPRFMLTDHRPDVLAMPEQLRGSTHFGDDVQDGTPQSDALLEAERSFVSPAGTFVLFDGSHGIHRGGQVQPGGSRWAIQMGFRVRNSRPHALNLARRLKWQAGYLKHLALALASSMFGR